MKKVILLTVSLFVVSNMYAENDANSATIYETDKNGVPTFSDQASPSQSEQAITINAPEPTSGNTNNQVTPQNQATALTKQLKQQDQKLYELQQQLSEANAALESAKKSLEQAQTAQEQGKTTIGGDQFLDTDLIRHLQQNVAEAQANYQQALDAYNSYRNNPEQVPN